MSYIYFIWLWIQACKIWGSHCGVLSCRSSGVWCCVEGQVVREVFKDHNAFIFRIKLSEQNSFLPSNAASHSRRRESYVTSHL